MDRYQQESNRCSECSTSLYGSGLFGSVRGAGSIEWITAGVTLIVLTGAVGKMMVTQSEKGAGNVGAALLAAVGLDEGGASNAQPEQRQGALPMAPGIQNTSLPNEGGFIRKPSGELIFVDPDGTERATSMDEAGKFYVDGPNGWTLAEVPPLPEVTQVASTAEKQCESGKDRCIDFGPAPSGPEWDALEAELKRQKEARRQELIEELAAQMAAAEDESGRPTNDGQPDAPARHRCGFGYVPTTRGGCAPAPPTEQNADDPGQPAFSAQDALGALTNQGRPTEDEGADDAQAELQDRLDESSAEAAITPVNTFMADFKATRGNDFLRRDVQELRDSVAKVLENTVPGTRAWAIHIDALTAAVAEETGQTIDLNATEEASQDNADEILARVLNYVSRAYYAE